MAESIQSHAVGDGVSPPKKKQRAEPADMNITTTMSNIHHNSQDNHECFKVMSSHCTESVPRRRSSRLLKKSPETNSCTLKDEEIKDVVRVTVQCEEENVAEICDKLTPLSAETSKSRVRHVKLSGGEKKNDRRKSKRRSSFVSGRISKPLLNDESPGESSVIAESIPEKLPPDLRLEMLHRKAIEYTMNRLQEEFPDIPGFEAFKVTVNDCANKLIEELKEKGDFIKATTPPVILLDCKESIKIDEQIEEAEVEIKKYNVECETWDKMLEQYKHQSEEAERHRKEIEETPPVLDAPPPKHLSKQHLEFLNGRPHYKQLMQDLQTLQEKQVLVDDTLNRYADYHSLIFSKARESVEQTSKHIAEASFPNLEGKSPRHLIENVLQYCDDAKS